MTYVIAEIGCEHVGDFKKAKQLINEVKESGANCAKFQLFFAKEVGQRMWKKIKPFHLPVNQLNELKKYCEKLGIDFLCSAFGLDSLSWIMYMGCDTVKIPSPLNENMNCLNFAVNHFNKVIISTGMMEKGKFCENYMLPKVKKLQCTSAYPCPYECVNLKTLSFFDGISDHTLGWEIPVAATALGAKIIEKHISLGDGPDAKCSLMPVEFKNMVQKIRNVELAMGDGIKRIEKCERKLLWRKST